MNAYRERSGDFAPPANEAAGPGEAVADAIGTDERRMHVRAYNHWCSLLDGRDFPSIEDLEPGDIDDFGPNSVLLDFTEGHENPATPYIGAAVRTECGLASEGVRMIEEVPSRSLLSRLTDHYMQIIANRAPVGFEAEFVNQRGEAIFYRGILMPFSSDGDVIDFIYGVINWKNVGDAPEPARVIKPALPPLPPEIDEEDEEDALEVATSIEPPAQAEPLLVAHLGSQDGPLADSTEPADEAEGRLELEDDAGLADRLSAARDSAEICKAADGRSRAALYRALAMAYDFAVAAKRVPEDYAEILDDAGVKAQARAPMTPIVKLVFGADYDKTRLTEFAAALNHAQRHEVDFGGFEAFLDAADGGLKGLVAAERKARRPNKPAGDRVGLAKAALRRAPSLALSTLATNEEFALVLTRRNANGIHEPVELVADAGLLERALRAIAN
ncbi:MAG TPA: hypothetical protein VNJ10_03360 [Sphingomonas sp.]|nr:hypothetical protein [Sphingomonas sp.]